MKKEIETKVSIGGRIVIPKEIREKLGIIVGSKALLVLKDRELILKPIQKVKKPVDVLYGSVRVKPEISPKKVAREWLKKHL